MDLRLIALPFLKRVAFGPSVAFFYPTLSNSSMYLLYLDESGNPDSPAEQHFILVGGGHLRAHDVSSFPRTQRGGAVS